MFLREKLGARICIKRLSLHEVFLEHGQGANHIDKLDEEHALPECDRLTKMNVAKAQSAIRKGTLGAELRDNWMPEKLWLQVKRYMPIPCLDVILHNSQDQILVGWRLIAPYRNVWALPGGRIYKGENLEAAAKRILTQYGVAFGGLVLVGVFPVKLVSRSDLSVCVAGECVSGVANPDGKEFSSFRWTKQLPRMGANYRRMISRWLRMKRDRQLLQFNEL